MSGGLKPGGTGGASLSDATPAALGTADAGVSADASRADHVHEAPSAGETALPRLSVASALHHWRLDDATTPFADAGSSAVSLAHVAGTREYERAGLYARYSATMQRSPTWLPVTDRAEATISDVLWHSRRNVTQHYSVAQIVELHAAREKIKADTGAWNKSLQTLRLEYEEARGKTNPPKVPQRKTA